MDKEKLTHVLTEFPNLIEANETEILGYAKKAEDLLAKIKTIQSVVESDVAKLTELFSNDSKRKAEVKLRLKTNKEYREAQEEHSRITDGQKIRAIKLDKQKRVFRAAESICRIGAR